jgi:hypothetical protein
LYGVPAAQGKAFPVKVSGQSRYGDFDVFDLDCL